MKDFYFLLGGTSSDIIIDAVDYSVPGYTTVSLNLLVLPPGINARYYRLSGTDLILDESLKEDQIDEITQKVLLGIGNVDNTSDLNKPVSTAQQAALNLKASLTATAALSASVEALSSSVDSRIATVSASVESLSSSVDSRIATVSASAANVNFSTFTSSNIDVTTLTATTGNVTTLSASTASVAGFKVATRLIGRTTATTASFTTSTVAGFTHQTDITVSNVVAADTPFVSFIPISYNTASEAGITLAECYAGGIRLYAGSVPSAQVVFDYVVIKE